MSNLENTIAAIRAKAEKEIAAAIHEARTRERVSTALGLDESNWSPGAMHVAYADCHIQFKADSLPAAIEMAEKANALGIFKIKDSCTSFRVESRIDEKLQARIDDGKATIEAVGCYFYKLEAFQQTKTLYYYVEADGLIVECRVKVSGDNLSFVRVESIPLGFGRYESRASLVNNSGYFRASVKWWASEPAHASYTLYS